MDFISNREEQLQAMLSTLGVERVDQLFAAIPAELKMAPPSKDDGLSEYEGMRLLEALAEKNSFSTLDNYLGAGAYEHHVPALVGAICSKSEFLTAYTPYQAEASQGTLQATFEFQSAICALTGLEVANASLYDGASACAEALLMALRINPERRRLLVGKSLHPHYRAVVEQYLGTHIAQIEEIPYKPDGTVNRELLEAMIDDQTAALLLQSPNFFGVVEELGEIFQRCRSHGAISILCANPLAYGLFRSAGEQGADVAVGDCQPFGIALQYGGPYAGYLACREPFMRQMPGRLVGETVDADGKRGFVLTLQAREQNIRREKATSNICTNQALAALASLVAMLWYGKQGVKKLALTNYQRAAYLKEKLEQVKGFSSFTSATCFNEFVVKVSEPMAQLQQRFLAAGIVSGLDLGRYFPELRQHLLVTVTETKSLEQLDRYRALAGRE
jgi:glycine dehydrogenase subunit 1